MPAGQGLILLQHINVYNTSCFLIDIEPSSPSCGDSVTITARVISENTIYPIGIVNIVDLNTNTIINSGSLNNTVTAGRSEVVITTTFQAGNYNLAAYYLGSSNMKVSNSLGFNYSVNTLPVTISPTFDSEICINKTTTLIADLSVNSLTEPVIFNWTNGSLSKQLGTASQDGYGGVATLVVPSDNIPLGDGYFQMIYPGNNCYNSAIIDGLQTVGFDYTTNIVSIVVSLSGGGSSKPHSATFVLNGVISDIYDSLFVSGTVDYTATRSDGLFVDLGSTTIIGGACNKTVTAGTLAIGAWSIVATYISDGMCFSDAISNTFALAIVPG